MHGRLKKDVVEPTAEEKEKQKEQVRTASALFAKLLELRKSRAFSQHALDMTSKALSFHPEFPTLWGYRREIITSGQIGVPLKDLLGIEMQLLEKALRKSQKVYSIWFHRRWVVERLFEEFGRAASADGAQKVLDAELELCGRLLSVDERNFHCWNHRAHVTGLMRRRQQEDAGAEAAGGQETQTDDKSARADLRQIDLSLSTDLINRNFSNYSAWHLRALLQEPPPPGCEAVEALQPLDIDLTNELDWVQQGIYTEPNDQSVWLYHHWLTLNRGHDRPRITHCAFFEGEFFVFFSRSVCVTGCGQSNEDQAENPAAASGLVKITMQGGASQSLSGQFEAMERRAAASIGCRTRQLPVGRQRWDLGWRFVPESGNSACDAAAMVTEVEVEASVEVLGSRADGGGAAVGSQRMVFKGPPVNVDIADSASCKALLKAALGPKLSAEDSLIQSELEKVQELLEIEPDCKWALLAQSRLASALAAGCALDEVKAAEHATIKGYDRMSSLDPLRKGFYAEAKSTALTRLRVLDWLASDQGLKAPLTFSGLGLRHLVPSVMVCAFGLRILNLEDNKLQDLKPVLHLLSLEELNAARNLLRGDVTEVFALPKLRRLDVKLNPLQLRGVNVVPPDALKEVDLSGVRSVTNKSDKMILDSLLAGSTDAERQGWVVERGNSDAQCVCRRQ